MLRSSRHPKCRSSALRSQATRKPGTARRAGAAPPASALPMMMTCLKSGGRSGAHAERCGVLPLRHHDKHSKSWTNWVVAGSGDANRCGAIQKVKSRSQVQPTPPPATAPAAVADTHANRLRVRATQRRREAGAFELRAAKEARAAAEREALMQRRAAAQVARARKDARARIAAEMRAAEERAVGAAEGATGAAGLPTIDEAPGDAERGADSQDGAAATQATALASGEARSVTGFGRGPPPQDAERPPERDADGGASRSGGRGAAGFGSVTELPAAGNTSALVDTWTARTTTTTTTTMRASDHLHEAHRRSRHAQVADDVAALTRRVLASAGREALEFVDAPLTARGAIADVRAAVPASKLQVLCVRPCSCERAGSGVVRRTARRAWCPLLVPASCGRP